MVALGWSLTRDKSLTLLARDAAQSTWVPVQTLPMNKGAVFEPLAFVPEQAGRLYVASNHEADRVMQDDVTDGTRWLVSDGLADPRRIALVGASYGGHAALMGVAREPTLYR